jgi:hypothetical protein
MKVNEWKHATETGVFEFVFDENYGGDFFSDQRHSHVFHPMME